MFCLDGEDALIICPFACMEIVRGNNTNTKKAWGSKGSPQAQRKLRETVGSGQRTVPKDEATHTEYIRTCLRVCYVGDGKERKEGTRRHTSSGTRTPSCSEG